MMFERADSHWADCEFAVLDVEGNGQSPQEIIEVAVVHVHRGEIVPGAMQWLVRPSRPVTDRAARLHGIGNAELVAKPTFEEVASEVWAALEKHMVIGHNVSIDVRMLKERLPHWRPALSLDTLKLAKRMLPSARSYELESLATERAIGMAGMSRHRAADDALVTARLFIDLVRELDQAGSLTIRRLAEVAALASDPFFNSQQQDLF